MSEITKEILQEALKGLSTKKDLDGIKTDISSLKADVAGIRTGLALLATSQELSTVSTRLSTIEGILNQHTTTLDAIVNDTSNWNTEMIVMRDRMKRYEDALKLVGQKLNLDLQGLLH